MIHVGTSGFSYKDWVGPYYPPELPERERLSFYAQEFDTVEINYSYYSIPRASTLAALADRTPDSFRFTIKAHQSMTHKRDDSAASFAQFVEALAPWQAAGRLGCVLAQFPTSFHNTPVNRNYLGAFRERMGDLPVVIEFRHRDWITQEVFDLLRKLHLGFCCVDQPQFQALVPPVAVATSDVAYVRFHGRNYSKWWQHEEASERYSYTYSAEELQPWVPKIRQLAQDAQETYVFANNHWQGQAIDTARQLRLLLDPTQA